MREFCRQGLTEVVSHSRHIIHETQSPPFSPVRHMPALLISKTLTHLHFHATSLQTNCLTQVLEFLPPSSESVRLGTVVTVLRGGFFVVRGRLGEETPCTVACHASSPDIFPLGTFVRKDEQGACSNSL